MSPGYTNRIGPLNTLYKWINFQLALVLYFLIPMNFNKRQASRKVVAIYKNKVSEGSIWYKNWVFCIIIGQKHPSAYKIESNI